LKTRTGGLLPNVGGHAGTGVAHQTMSSEPTALRHNALLYATDDEYLARVVPFLKDGLEAGEGAIVAHTRRGLAMIRETLGADAAQVTFVDVSAAYTRPARALAAYHAVYAEQLRRTPKLRAVADVQFGPDPAEWELWTAYEAVFNRSFAHIPAWILCSYNANGTPDPILEGVRQTHPEIVDEGGWSVSDRYEEPDRLLRRAIRAPAALAGLPSIPFGHGLEELRDQVAPTLAALGVGPAQSLDMLLATTEVADNAIRHGGGIVDVRLGRSEGRVVCEIVDRGSGFDDPAAGFLAPRAGIGKGLWVARQLTWQIEFFNSTDGFTVRIRL
jgi:anti-sigma regulatory factor (Ser/Thr protein kinase)